MNNIPLIVWDVDDVLNTLMHSWLNDWNSRNGSSYNYEDLKENPPHQIIGISKEKYLSDLDHFRESKSGKQVSYNPFIMKWFRENGHKFHHIACTARPLESRGFQAHWVYKNFNQWIYTVNMSN